MHAIDPNPSGRNVRGMLRVGGAIALFVAALIVWEVFSAHRAAAKLKEATGELSIVNVATVHPKHEAADSALSLPGSVEANFDAPIYARTSGYLKRWLVDIGSQVKEGQVLAEIDAPELDQQLRQAQADMANAAAGQKIAQLTADRWRNLRDTDSVSSQQSDEKISQAATGTAQLQSAQANLQRLRELSGFKKIIAPFDGVVTVRNVDVGQLITAGSSSGPELFRIADTRRLRLYVHVPQAYAAAMQPGLTATVLFPDRPGLSYAATLDRTSNALDPTTRTLLAQLIVDNSKHELLPGAYAEVHFRIPDLAQNAFKLPINTLMFRGDGVRVATVDGQNQVQMKPVNIGREYGLEVEIIQGVDAADNVILNPPDALVDRAAVRIVQPASPAKPARS